MLELLLFTSLLVGQAASADRHCSAALDYYFQARAAVLAGELNTMAQRSCSAAQTEVTDRLAQASAEAQVCGCRELQQATEVLSGQAQAAENCAAIKPLILDAGAMLEKRLQACH